MISGVGGLVSFVMGDATSLAEFKDVSKLEKAVKFIKSVDAKELFAMLKNSKLLSATDAASTYSFLDGLKGISDLIRGTVSSSMHSFFLLLGFLLNCFFLLN